jgi:hypothetical protein
LSIQENATTIQASAPLHLKFTTTWNQLITCHVSQSCISPSMPLLKRLSDTFWSFVSPGKPAAQPHTPATAPPVFKKPALPTRPTTFKKLKRVTKSMSPASRVDSWRATTSTSPSRRKRPAIPDDNGIGNHKMRKLDNFRVHEENMEDEEMEDCVYEHHDDSGSDEAMKDDDDDGLSSMFSGVRVNGSPTPEDFLDEYDSEVDVDETRVLDDGDYYATPTRRKITTLPQEQEAFGVGSSEMRAAGWDDDYITLVQKIKLRGHEPLMPQSWRFSLRSMPDALFAPTDDAFIGSICNQQFHAEKALEELLYLGGQVRDSTLTNASARPELHARRMIEAYQKWAALDSGLDPHTAIPLIVLETKPGSTSGTEIHESANRKLALLATRFRAAFRVLPSTEGSPGSKASTQYSYPVPTLYAIVASHTLIAVLAYKPDDETPDAKPIAFFDMTDSNYDVWNSLALSITVCHARNVQVRIAEDTGLGVKVPGRKRRGASDDPDL